MKRLLLVFFALILWVSCAACSSSNERIETISSEGLDSEISVTQEEIIQTEINVTEIEYHKNAHINRLINSYNELATYPISAEMITDGAYDFRALVSCNGVGIIIDATENNGLFIDFEDENLDDELIKVLFRDFCKTINPQVTDDDIDSIWAILQSEKPTVYTPYNFGGIDCAYYITALNNGETRFKLKTTYYNYY